MKKGRIVILLLLCLLSVSLLQNVNAAVSVRRIGSEKLSRTDGKTYSMYLYRANIDGTDYMTYCLDPGRPYGQNGGGYQIIHVVDPSTSTGAWQKFDIAATYAYQYMQKNGYATTNQTNNIIGELVFRWITQTYVSGGCYHTNGGRCISGGSNQDAYNLFNRLTAGFSQGDSRVAIATDIYNRAIAVAQSGQTYDQLVQLGFDNGGIWGLSWNTQNFRHTTSSDGLEEIYVELVPQTNVNKIYPEQFKAIFTNPTLANNIVSQEAKLVNNNTVGVTVRFNKGSWDGSDPGLEISTAYCDSLSAASQLYLIGKNTSNPKQRMLAVMPGTTCPNTISSGSPHGGGRTKIPWDETCTCDTSTGNYTYKKYKNGSLILEKTWAYGTTAPSEVDTSKCPNTCEKNRSCEKENNKFYCKDGKECPEKDYKEQCLKPSCSKDGNDYYCNDHDGDGSGDKCDQKQYEKDCECPKLEDECEKDPNSPSCDEYNKKCVNCNPAVSLPDDCGELVNNPEAAYTIPGSISDISQKAAACNEYKKNQVKACVIDKQDATGEKYESSVDGVTNNRYCKVYCDESYNFTLPSAQRTQSGGYFTLSNLSISGTRNCYTASAMDSTKPIGYNSANENQFMKDLQDAYKKYIEGWNEYRYNQLMAESETVTQSCRCGDCSEDGSGPDDEYHYNTGFKGYNTTLGNTSQNVTVGPSSETSCSDKSSSYNSSSSSGLTKAKQAIEEINQILKEYNSCSGAIQNGNLASIMESLNADSPDWQNQMKFDPKVTFSYNESYKNIITGEFEKSGNEVVTSTNTFCSGDTNNEYACLSGGTNDIRYSEIAFMRCSSTGCTNQSIKISTAKWIQKTKNYTSSFKAKDVFSTYTPFGTIRPEKNNANVNTLYTNLPENSFPISLIQKTGVFPFTFTFANIGQSNQISGELGRLIGRTSGNKDVITAYGAIPADEKCTDSDRLSSEQVSSSTNAGYVCHYLNNCDDCDFFCKDDECTFDDEECDGECEFTCDTCIFDGKRLTYSYRTVSLNGLFPNERPVGYNWNNNLKGEITRQLIEKSRDSESPETIYNTPQYSYTLTPTNLKNIRKYNDEAGSYTNATIPSSYSTRLDQDASVYCDNYKDSTSNKEYSVRCRSGFLDLLDRQNNEFATDVYRITNEGESAWELFDAYKTEYCPSGYGLDTCKGIGPSWRIRSDVK